MRTGGRVERSDTARRMSDEVYLMAEQGLEAVADLNARANVHYRQRRNGDAAALFAQALAIRERHLDPEHPDVRLSANNLANCYRNLGRWAEAEPLYRRSLAMRERQLGADSPELAANLRNLATVCRPLGKDEEADALEARASSLTADQV